MFRPTPFTLCRGEGGSLTSWRGPANLLLWQSPRLQKRMRCSLLVLGYCVAESDKKKRDDEVRARGKNDDAQEKDAIGPTPDKVPEGEGNLRRRADWFQKRTGGTG